MSETRGREQSLFKKCQNVRSDRECEIQNEKCPVPISSKSCFLVKLMKSLRQQITMSTKELSYRTSGWGRHGIAVCGISTMFPPIHPKCPHGSGAEFCCVAECLVDKRGDQSGRLNHMSPNSRRLFVSRNSERVFQS